jgi:acetyl esterase/lipase
MFHDEDLAYAERLRAAGVACPVETVPRMYHGAFSLAPDTSAIVSDFRTSATSALRTALSPAAESRVSER